MRWPGHIEPGTVSNQVFSHQEMLPTLLAVAGDPDVVEKAKKGFKVGGRTFKVHLDGHNLLPLLNGEVDEHPRPGFIYWSDDGDLLALRYGDWKFHFALQRAHGLGEWEEPFVRTRTPTFSDLRNNPFEIDAEDAAFFFNKEKADRIFLLLPAVALVSQYLQTFVDFPPRARPASFSVDQALEKARAHQEQMEAAAGGR
jgi:arylsulfatase